MHAGAPRSPALLTLLALLWFASAVMVALLTPAGNEAARILYLMVPSGWVAVGALVALFLCSAAYLGTGNGLWDHLARAAAELALLFAGIAGAQAVFISRATGGSWVGLEVRGAGYVLVAAVAAACLLARHLVRDRAGTPRVAATVGCGGFLVAGVSRAWLGGLESIRSVGEGVTVEEVPTVAVLWLSSLALTAVFVWLLGHRVLSLELAHGRRDGP